jgi:hypothetical protein
VNAQKLGIVVKSEERMTVNFCVEDERLPVEWCGEE